MHRKTVGEKNIKCQWLGVRGSYSGRYTS